MDFNLYKQNEYEQQYFGCSSKFFLDSFKSVRNDEIEAVVLKFIASVKKKLLPQAKNQKEFKEKLEAMKTSILRQYTSSLENALNEAQDDIMSYMNIPEHLLLEEDLIIKNSLDKNVEDIDEKIRRITETIQANACMKKLMLEEINVANSVISLNENFIAEKNIDLSVFPIYDAHGVLMLAEKNLELC